MSTDPRRDLAVLRQLTERLSDGRPLEDALQDVTDAALELLPCDHASIRLFDASRTTLLAGARSGRGVEQRTLAIAKGEGIAGWVMEHAMPAHVRDTKSDPRFIVAVGQGFSIRSMIAEPLLVAGKPMGVLGRRPRSRMRSPTTTSSSRASSPTAPCPRSSEAASNASRPSTR